MLSLSLLVLHGWVIAGLIVCNTWSLERRGSPLIDRGHTLKTERQVLASLPYYRQALRGDQGGTQLLTTVTREGHSC